MIHTSASGKTLTLAVAPSYALEQQPNFAQLGRWIKQYTEHDLVVVSAENYYYYWKDACSKQPDLTLDPAHLAAYRINQLGYVPMVKTKEPMILHLVANKKNESVEETNNETFNLSETDHLQQFSGKTISMLQQPSLSAILFEQWFVNWPALPRQMTANKTWEDVNKKLQQGLAHAAIVPSWVLHNNDQLVSIKKSQPFPGMAFLASPKLDESTVTQITAALLHMNNQDVGEDVLRVLNTAELVPVNGSEFSSLDTLIPERYQALIDESLVLN